VPEPTTLPVLSVATHETVLVVTGGLAGEFLTFTVQFAASDRDMDAKRASSARRAKDGILFFEIMVGLDRGNEVSGVQSRFRTFLASRAP
jgi:hypothetical protein